MKWVALILLVTACGTESAVDCFRGCKESQTAVNGTDGAPGRDGRDGADGLVGPAGPQGLAGQDGIAGRSCTVTDTAAGATISCEDGSSAEILDGPVGQSGVIAVIDPCGKQRSDGFDEILIRLATGELFGVYFNHQAKESSLVSVPPGTYQTTDGTLCVFTVTAEGQVL